MTEDDIEIIERRTAFQGYMRVEAYRLRHRLFAGGWGREISREVLKRDHAVAVLPYDPKRDAVVLIEQFRIGALTAGMAPWVTEIVAGLVEPGENPEDVARRESIEEAGCALLALEPICRYLSTPGCSNETVTMFCGRIDSAGIGGVHGLADEGEDIRVEVVSFAEAMARLAAGRIDNAIAIIGLQWLALNRERLRALWLAP